jgi:CBS domain-containing protein
MKVKEIMNRKPLTVNPDTPLDDLIQYVLGQIDDCFPVVGKKRELLGIITESDILRIFKVPSRHAFVGISATKEMRRSATRAREIMTSHPITTTPDTDVEEVIGIMADHGIRHIPVVKRNKLVGVIAFRQILDRLPRS